MFFPPDQRLLVLRRSPEFTEAGHTSEGAGLDVSSESDDIQHNREGDCSQAQPDNVVRVEVAGGQLLVVVDAVVDVLVLAIALHGSEIKIDVKVRNRIERKVVSQVKRRKFSHGQMYRLVRITLLTTQVSM